MTGRRIRQVALVAGVLLALAAVAFFLVAVWGGDIRWAMTGVITFLVAFITIAASWIGGSSS